MGVGVTDVGKLTVQAAAAIAANKRVKFSGGKVAEAGLADNDVGTLDVASLAADEHVAMNLRNKPGTVFMVAAAPISLHADVYTAAAGKISATAAGTSYKRGKALEAATADGDVIAVLPVWTNTAES